jgi:hypothetical protein
MPYVLNEEARTIPTEPQLWDGKHYVPLAPVVEQLGGTVNWDNNSKTASATIGQWTAQVQEGNPDVDVNGTHVQLAVPPRLENDTMWVPWDFFRDAYGYKVSMEGGTLNVHL